LREFTHYTDIKILIFAAGCGLGYWSHFIVKFPDEFHLLIVALLSYGILMSIHFLIESKLEKAAFFIAKSHNTKGLESFQKMYFHSEVDPTKSNDNLDYELEMVAINQ